MLAFSTPLHSSCIVFSLSHSKVFKIWKGTVTDQSQLLYSNMDWTQVENLFHGAHFTFTTDDTGTDYCLPLSEESCVQTNYAPVISYTCNIKICGHLQTAYKWIQFKCSWECIVEIWFTSCFAGLLTGHLSHCMSGDPLHQGQVICRTLKRAYSKILTCPVKSF